MSAPIPTTEPQTFIAGDTLAFTKTFPNYTPGDGWTLNYSLQGKTLAGSWSASPITFSSSTNTGAKWSISVSKTTTAAYAPGDYRFTAYVTGGTSERYTVGSGDITILADPSAAVPTSHAVRTLALIEAAMESRIPRGLEQTIIDGQSLIRIPLPELSKLRDKYRAEVRAEQDAARIATGLSSRRSSVARFIQPK
jgi:hypothetical protein